MVTVEINWLTVLLLATITYVFFKATYSLGWKSGSNYILKEWREFNDSIREEK